MRYFNVLRRTTRRGALRGSTAKNSFPKCPWLRRRSAALNPRVVEFKTGVHVHDVASAIIRTCEGEGETAAWLLCDHKTYRKYGLGFAKAFPMPTSLYTRSGYLLRGKTLADLARITGIDPKGLAETVRTFNIGAEHGEDPEFGKGGNLYNRYLGDPDHQPNPCVAPVGKGPYYAVKVTPGDLGTFDGIRTDRYARVRDARGDPIPGLYAVGNDAASIMGGNYPGGGITLGPIMTFGYIAGRHLAGQAD